MANTLLTPDRINKVAMFDYWINSQVVKEVDRQWDSYFDGKGAGEGNTLRLRRALRGQTTFGSSSFSAINYEQRKETLVVATPGHMDLTFTSAERTLQLPEFEKNVTLPLMAQMAGETDAYLLSQYVDNIYNFVGTPGAGTLTWNDLASAVAKINIFGAKGNIKCFLNSDMSRLFMNSGLTLFNPNQQLSAQWTTGEISQKVAGFEKIIVTNAIPSHLVGNYSGGTPKINGVGQSGSNLITDGWPVSRTGLLKKGDRFTITTGNAVNVFNPVHRNDSGILQQFVATADVNSDGSGNATIPISPSLDATTIYRTVTNLPSDNADISVAGNANTTYRVGVAYHQQALAAVFVELENPEGSAKWAQHKMYNFAMRFTDQWTSGSDSFNVRFDTLFGLLTMYPEFACVIYI